MWSERSSTSKESCKTNFPAQKSASAPLMRTGAAAWTGRSLQLSACRVLGARCDGECRVEISRGLRQCGIWLHPNELNSFLEVRQEIAHSALRSFASNLQLAKYLKKSTALFYVWGIALCFFECFRKLSSLSDLQMNSVACLSSLVNFNSE